MEETPNHPLLTLIDLGQRARSAQSADELAFLAVNDTYALAPYRQAVLWWEDGGVRAVSGLVQVEKHAPFVHFLNRLGTALSTQVGEVSPAPLRLIFSELDEDLAAEWSQWLPAEGLWIPLRSDVRDSGPTRGGLLLTADAAWEDNQLTLLGEWAGVWLHAWRAMFRPAPWSLARLKIAVLNGWSKLKQAEQDKPWWQRRRQRFVLLVLAVLFFPVRLSVLAQGELLPANPAVIRAPLDGVIGQIHVRPNQVVKSGDVLFSFDEAPIAARLEVARQSLATAEAEYRQTAQLALNDAKVKGQMAMLLGKIAEKRAEAEFVTGQFERARVQAPQDGIVMLDDPTEWIGRPVKTGERVMRVADPADAEIEAWIPIVDAIPLPEKASVSLYLAASPFSSVKGELRYLGHDAMPRPDGTYAYRLRASLSENTSQRIGSKGTVRISGDWVPLVYWVTRRPLAAARQFLVR